MNNIIPSSLLVRVGCHLCKAIGLRISMVPLDGHLLCKDCANSKPELNKCSCCRESFMVSSMLEAGAGYLCPNCGPEDDSKYCANKDCISSRVRVGSIVSRKNGESLRSGCQAYDTAIVTNLDPFTLVSSQMDMKWTKVDIEDFNNVSFYEGELNKYIERGNR